jgi:hypothetical protein
MLLIFNPDRTEDDSGDVPAHGARGAGHVAFGVPGSSLSDWRRHLDQLAIPIEAEVHWPKAKPQSNHWTGEKSYCCFPEQLYLMSDVLA